MLNHIFSSFILTLACILPLKKWGHLLGLIDHPGGRKKHHHPIPTIGGIAIFISISLLWAKQLIFIPTYQGFWIASLLLVCIGIMDDKYSLTPKTRILFHSLCIACIILIGKTYLYDLGDLLGLGQVGLGKIAFFFTCFAIIGIINTVNMMDGIDGLTGCISSVEFSLLLYLAYQQHAWIECQLILVCLGALFAFLCFNFPSPFSRINRIFLGDAGSMLIGLILAWLCIRLTQHDQGYPAVLMLWILALPLMDTLYLMINRKIRKVSPFKADRRHIHHTLLKLGYTPKQSTLILTTCAYGIGQLGILLYQQGVPDYQLFYLALIIFMHYMTLMGVLKKRIIKNKYKPVFEG